MLPKCSSFCDTHNESSYCIFCSCWDKSPECQILCWLLVTDRSTRLLHLYQPMQPTKELPGLKKNHSDLGSTREIEDSYHHHSPEANTFQNLFISSSFRLGKEYPAPGVISCLNRYLVRFILNLHHLCLLYLKAVQEEHGVMQ